MKYLAPVILLVLLPLVVQGEIMWENEPTWGFQAVLGSDSEMECNDTNANLKKHDVLTWQTPNKTQIFGGTWYNHDKYELINKNDVTGMILKIKKVAVEDHGIYYCHVTRNSVEYRRVMRALNLYEPAYSSKIDKYRYNIMVGGIAAAVFFVPVVGACLIQKFRYQTDEERNTKRELRERAKQLRDMYEQQLNDNDEGELQSKVPQTNDAFTNEAYQLDSTKL